MKFNKNIALQVLMLLQAGQVAAMDGINVKDAALFGAECVGGKFGRKSAEILINTANDPQAMNKLQEQGQQAVEIAAKKAEELKDDSINMFQSYKISLLGAKDPLIGAIIAGLVIQKKSGQAKEFKKQATSPYYPYGLMSFITGTAFMAAAPFSKSSKELVIGGLTCWVASYGCFCKSRSDLITLKNKIIKQASSAK